MPIIRPSSELRNNYSAVSELCHEYNEPVFITRNGREDLVVMSNQEYERLSGRQELARLLERGLRDAAEGRVQDAEAPLATSRPNSASSTPSHAGLQRQPVGRREG